MTRTFIYGMQSSGASLFAVLCSQAPGTLGIIDLWNAEVAPALEHAGDITLKATVGSVEIEQHLAAFMPDVTILFLRNPLSQISTLTTKRWRDYAVPLEDKLGGIEQAYKERDRFDLVVRYEDFIRKPDNVSNALRACGVPIPPDAHDFPRPLDAIVAHARNTEPWCNDNWRVCWGVGEAQVSPGQTLRQMGRPLSDDALRLAVRHCPDLLGSYDDI